MDKDQTIKTNWEIFMRYDEVAIQSKQRARNWQWWFSALVIAPAVLAAIAVYLPVIHTDKGSTIPILKPNDFSSISLTLAFVVGVISALLIAIEKFLQTDNGELESRQVWVKSRAAAEGIRSNLYLFAHKAGIYNVDAPEAAITLLNQEVQKLQDNAPEVVLGSMDVTKFELYGKEPKANATIGDYILNRAKDQVTWYEGRITVLQKKADKATWVVRGIGIASAVLGVLVVSLSITFALPALATIATAVKTYNEKNKYRETMLKYNAAKNKITHIISLQGITRDNELVSACEQVLSAENGNWQQMWQGK